MLLPVKKEFTICILRILCSEKKSNFLLVCEKFLGVACYTFQPVSVFCISIVNFVLLGARSTLGLNRNSTKYSEVTIHKKPRKIIYLNILLFINHYVN